MRKVKKVKRGVSCSIMEPLLVAHISDLHFRKGDDWKLKAIEEISSYEPDFIFITGDFIDHENGLRLCRKALSSLKATYGVYGVFGGHDYYQQSIGSVLRGYLPKRNGQIFHKAHDVEAMRDIFMQEGLEILRNESRQVMTRAGLVSIIGLDETFYGYADIDKAFEAVPQEAFKILLVHCPIGIDGFLAKKPHLCLAGHTHGGQVRVPLLGPLKTNSELKRNQALGTFQLGETTFHVTSGLGTGHLTPFRLFCSPEVALVEIKPKVLEKVTTTS